MDDITYEPSEYLRGTFPPTLAPTQHSETNLINEMYLSIIISISGIGIILGIIYIRKLYNARL
jgi:uncharacterized membrane protein affecting hemolysin expression